MLLCFDTKTKIKMKLANQTEKFFYDLRQSLGQDHLIDQWVHDHLLLPILAELYDRLEFFDDTEDLKQEFSFLIHFCEEMPDHYKQYLTNSDHI